MKQFKKLLTGLLINPFEIWATNLSRDSSQLSRAARPHRSFPSSSLGMQCGKLQLPVSRSWSFVHLVPKLELGNERLSRLKWVVEICIKIIGGGVLFCAFAGQAAENPHAVSATDKSSVCTGCHVTEIHYDKADLLNTKNNQVDLTAFNNDGVVMCSGCHNAEEGHKVGLKLDFEIPADMPLNKKNTLSCLTCHYTHGNLDSVRPQASFSFMDRMVNADRLHKSFLLRRNNVDGELCLICHNSNQGSK